MSMSITSYLWMVLVTVLAAVGFCHYSNQCLKATDGRKFDFPTVVAVLCVLLIGNFVIVKWFFHPIVYLVFIGICFVMEFITIRRTKPDESRMNDNGEGGEAENPFHRFGIWASLIIAAQVGVWMASARLADLGSASPLALNNGRKTFLLLAVPAIIALFIGMIKAVLASGETSSSEVVKQNRKDSKNHVADELEDIPSTAVTAS